jgi:protein PhnA
LPVEARAGGRCELCGVTEGLAAAELVHAPASDEDGAVWACADCRAALASAEPLEGERWFALQDSAWSEVLPVQVAAWRLLHRVAAPWAAELRDQIWLDDEVRAWAELGLQADEGPAVVDCNGTVLADGDSVTLIKDLAVKGAGFTAKRGTMVRNIRLIDDPSHIEGKVNGTAIYLKTEFLKRA